MGVNKMGGNYRHLGKATPRKDAKDIVTGHAQYIDDLKLQGMLYGRVLRSPYPHARILNIDTSKAETYPGVKAVLTYKNVPNWIAGVPYHRPVLDGKVNFVGDAVALLAAETEQAADEALELIEVEYEQLPAVFDMEEAAKPGAPQIHKRIPNNIFPRGFPAIGENALQELVMGDVEKGFQEADVIEEATCAYENIPNPLPPEPPGVVALWEDADHQLWVCTRIPVRRVASASQERPPLIGDSRRPETMWYPAAFSLERVSSNTGFMSR